MNADALLVERLKDVVPAGGAICLMGAGFSTAATDQQGKFVPSTHDLIQEIKDKVGLDVTEQASLSDIAEYCEEDPIRQNVLRRLLMDRLTLSNPTNAQRAILNQPWQAIFTTNFDDIIERGSPPARIQIITPRSNVSARIPGKMPIYYLHGRAMDLVESDGDPRLVISESNYLNLHDLNRDLYAQLKNALFAAKLIVIVGYSVRDLEIARIILGSGQTFSRKTVLVCSPNEKALAVSRLRKFGEVLSIGVEGLAHELRDLPITAGTALGQLQFVKDASLPKPASEIDDTDFVKLILTGNFDRAKFVAQLQRHSATSPLYSIERHKHLNDVIEGHANGVSRFVALSDLGNGKSVFLEQLACKLPAAGYRVIEIASRSIEVFTELEAIICTNGQTAYIIDDVIRLREVAKFIGTRLNSLSIMICGMRGDAEEAAVKELTNSLGGAARLIDLNILSTEELQEWDVALERWGLWERRISLSASERVSFLRYECSSENRSIVLALFRSSRIAIKIDQIVDFFINRGRHERTFAALLISSLCQRHVSWESIVSWLDIDEQRLRKDISQSDLAELFVNGRDWNLFTSAQLAEYILRNKYVYSNSDTLLDVYSIIVLTTAESASDSYLGDMYRENLKELMKFRFLTKLFGEGEPAALLISRVYKRLADARLIRDNPQFWLQYAMSRIEVGDLESAETYLNTALGLAVARGKNYSPFQILDQRVRLYFRKNTRAEGVIKVSEIKQALKDLRDLLSRPDGEVIYLYRSVPLIQAFVELQIDFCDHDMRAEMADLLERVKTLGQSFTRLPRSQKGETRVLQKAMNEVLIVLRFA